MKFNLDLENKKAFFLSACFFVFLGIFFRTYNFSDWLLFNSDQARDASVIKGMIENGEIPLLGPIAGGTLFQLGPAFYYFQFIGAKLFGVFPDKMAYPDLFFGIMAIPLAYFLFRQYFKKNISLVLAGLYSVSFFSVQYSRFAWNPNSTQFFSMLFVYAMIRLSDYEENRKILWLIFAGLSMGIGMQLHTLLLFGMPFALFLVGAYLIKNRYISFLNMIVILLLVFIINVTQVVSEIKTGGSNYLEFRKALIDKSGSQSSLWKNAVHVVSCQFQSNAKILVPYADQEICESPLADKFVKRLDRRNEKFIDWSIFAGKFFVAISFSVAGYFLLYRNIKRGDDIKRKKDLWIIALFNAALLGIFAPFGAEISLRYFILMAFVPFFLLGLCAEAVFNKHSLLLKYTYFILITALILYNIFFCIKTFREYAGDIQGNMINGTAKQVREMSNFIVTNSDASESVLIGGKKLFLQRFINRISYFANESNIEVLPYDDKINLMRNIPVFLVMEGSSEKCESGMEYKNGLIEKCGKFANITIIKMQLYAK